MSETQYSLAGEGADDILEYRTAPFPLRISDTSTSSISTLSNRTDRMSKTQYSLAGEGEDDILEYITAPFPLRFSDTSTSLISTPSNKRDRMSKRQYSLAGEGEDDILAYRTAPFPLKFSDTSTSSTSMLLNRTDNKGDEAILLSDATNQATRAAYSVLSAGRTESTALNTAKAVAASVLRSEFEKKNGLLGSGRTESTALNTAKAVAASVLRSEFEKKNGSIGSGQKDFFLKRRIKKQAEVLASVALVVAVKKIRQQEDNGKLKANASTKRNNNCNSFISSAQTSKFSNLEKLKPLRDDGTYAVWKGWKKSYQKIKHKLRFMH
eukprot:CAMPEP_0194196300 /NCGR_PEP_ID=MMETSP0154-20130528/76593_1 /TAXON_ID=1049557 /ORGANISM="Thalassiothrix antarctica, Strain L6-D1" /LENGTH=323 /DNA_ID=CAMNT_0038920887 /DNA_START=65 /DNA_END=1036 /DNA_ORIENTATION=+